MSAVIYFRLLENINVNLTITDTSDLKSGILMSNKAADKPESFVRPWPSSVYRDRGI